MSVSDVSAQLAKLTNNSISGNDTTITGSLTISDNEVLSIPVFPINTRSYEGFTVSASTTSSSINNATWPVASPTFGAQWKSAATYPSNGGNYTGAVTTTASGTSYSGEWWQIQNTTKKRFTLTSVQLANNASLSATNFQTFSVLGSVDGASWTFLGSGSLTNVVTITSSFRMLYCRIVCTATATNQTIKNAAILSRVILTGKSASGSLTIAGSTTLQALNVDSLTTTGAITQTAGTTTLKAATVDSLATAGDIVQTGSGTTMLKSTEVDSLFASGDVEVGGPGNITQSGSGTTTLKATTVASLATSGNITQTGSGATTLNAATVASLTTSGAITQTGGSSTLKAATVDSLATAGNITQTGGSSTLKATTVDSLATAGNITQTAPGTSTLKATTVASLATAGNITQTGGSSTLKATTVDSLATSGNITQTGAGTTTLKATTVDSLTTVGTVSAATVVQSTPSILSYYLGILPATTSGTTTTVLFDTSKINQGTHGLTYTAANGRFTNTSGSTRAYEVVFNAGFTLNTTGQRQITIEKSTGALPTNAAFSTLMNAASALSVMFLNVSGVVVLPNNEYISCAVYQNSGSSLGGSTCGVTIIAL